MNFGKLRFFMGHLKNRGIHWPLGLLVGFLASLIISPHLSWAQAVSSQPQPSVAPLVSPSSLSPPPLWGIALGQTLSLAECPFRRVGPQKIYDAAALQTPCIKDAQAFPGHIQTLRRVVFPDDHEQVFNVLDRTVYVQEQHKRVIGIYYKTPGLKTQTYTLWELINWIGQASQISYLDRENLTGQKTVSITAKWNRPWGQVVFESARENAQVGYVSIRQALAHDTVYAK